MNQCKVCGHFSTRNLCRSCVKKFSRINCFSLFRLKPYKRTFKTQQTLYKQIKVLFKKRTFQECVFDWYPFKRYDIAVPELKLIVEYDGIQHFKQIKFFHKNREEFDLYRANDHAKEEIAKIQGWKVIRFNYMEDVKDRDFVRSKLEKEGIIWEKN